MALLDQGIATENNLIWMQQEGYRYLVVNRRRAREFDLEDCITIETASEEKVHLKKVHSDDGKEVRLYCYSERRARKEEGIAKRFMARFEAGLEKPHKGCPALVSPVVTC